MEQKNGRLIHRVVRHERFVVLKGAQVLTELYAELRLYTDLIQSSIKIKSRAREVAGTCGSTKRREDRCGSSWITRC